MEDNIQTVVVVIISVFLLFIFPVYMAYEKKDDISYALAMRYTQDLVDEVRSKGYISKNMYEDYMARLKVTGNSYDVQITHEYKRYDPITNYYKIEDGKYIFVKTTTREEKEEFEASITRQAIELGNIAEDSSENQITEYINSVYEAQNIQKVEDTYRLSTETYTTDHILNVLNSERKLLLNSDVNNIKCSDDTQSNDGCQYAYIMNVDDNFNITIKNTNITLATVIYNMVTANTLDDNTRIYVNYGGAILSNKWYGDVDYAKMKHDNLSLTKKHEQVVFAEARHYFTSDDGDHYPTANISMSDNGDTRYVIEFEVKPEETTELREKGNLNLDSYSGYNFALGNSVANNAKDRLSVSVGFNGISLLVSSTANSNVKKTFYLPYYNQIMINDNGQQVSVQAQRQITDYNQLRIFYQDGKLKCSLAGNSNVDDANITNVVAQSDVYLWSSLNKTINNPKVNTYSAGTASNINEGLNTSYSIQVYNSYINVTANSIKEKRQTILSYAASIDQYTKVKIEFNEQASGSYVAALYVNDIKVAESLTLATVPIVDIVGKSIIGTEEQYFSGYIRNVKIYEMGD